MAHAPMTRWLNTVGGVLLPSFLGLAATRVWLQVNLFASYTSSDDGLFTIVSNLAYGMAMLVGAALALHRPFSPRGRAIVSWLGTGIMTASSALILAGKETGGGAMLLPVSVIAGVGAALGGGMWTTAYVRLDLRQSVLHGFLSLALGSIGGLALSFLPETQSGIASMIMPPIALLCYRRAVKADASGTMMPEPVYDEEPRTTMLFILGGIAVFGLALGVSRGFPAGMPVPMDVMQRVVHQMGVAACSLFIIWWFIVERKRLSFSFLWRMEIMIMATGMLMISVLPGRFSGLAIATVNIADSLMLGVLWVTLQDVARHTTIDTYAVYGFAWASRVLSRDLGRIFVMIRGMMGTSSHAATVVIAVIVFALATSMTLLLSDGIPRMRPLFSQNDEHRQQGSVQTVAVPIRRIADHNASGCSECPPQKALTQPDGTHEWLRRAFCLTERETEVAMLIAQGRSKAYIADQLFVSENTVRTHAKNIYTKLGVHSKQSLIDVLQNRPRV